MPGVYERNAAKAVSNIRPKLRAQFLKTKQYFLEILYMDMK